MALDDASYVPTPPTRTPHHDELAETIWTSLGEQTVAVPDARTAEKVLPKLADRLKTPLSQREDSASEVERIRDANKIKMLKRQTYGRSSFPLLCKRSLLMD